MAASPAPVSYAVLPGAGSAGLVWDRVAAELGGATVLPLPDQPDVPAMAAVLEGPVRRLPGLRGQPVLLRHMRVLAAHRPEPLPSPPPTLVLCGDRDPGVPRWIRYLTRTRHPKAEAAPHER